MKQIISKHKGKIEREHETRDPVSPGSLVPETEISVTIVCSRTFCEDRQEWLKKMNLI